MNVTITRTHRLGQPLHPADRITVPGPIIMETVYSQTMRRYVEQLVVWRSTHGGATPAPSPIPALNDPHILTLATEYGGMMLSGFEEIEGRRYYQGWYIRFGESLNTVPNSRLFDQTGNDATDRAARNGKQQ